MALPTIEKTWLYKVNIPLVSTGDYTNDWRQFWYTLKTALTTASGWTDANGSAATHPAPWVVVRSRANGAVGVDTWTSPGVLSPSGIGTDHSWIVMRNGGNAGAVGGSNPIELCFDWGTQYGYWIGMTMCLAMRGFDLTTGTTSTPPSLNSAVAGNTALYLIDNRESNLYFLNIGYTTAFSAVLHVMMTADGKSLRVVLMNGTAVMSTFFIEEAGQPIVGQDTPGYAYWPSKIVTYGKFARSYVNVADLTDKADARVVCKDTAGMYRVGSVYFSTLFFSSNSFVENLPGPNDATMEFPLTQIGVVCNSAGMCGPLGVVSDMWFGSTYFSAGDSYPADGTKKFMHLGNIVVPWNGTNLMVVP